MKDLKIRIQLAILVFTVLGANAQTPVVGNGTGSGNALNFNGSTNWIDIGNNSLLKPSFLTVQVWINPATSGIGYRMFLNEGDIASTSSTSGYFMRLTPSNQIDAGLYVGNNSGTSYVQLDLYSPALTLGNWHNIAMTYDQIKLRLYVDGVCVDSVAENRVIDYLGTYQGLKIGTAENNGSLLQYFPGKIDEVRIWNRALTQSELRDSICKKLKGTETGLVGYWRMDEGTGTSTTDATANGNTGILH